MTFTCSATGLPEPMITWSKSQGSLPASSNITSEGKLTILNVTTDDSGSYLCNATNAIGTNSSFVELKVFCSLVHINRPTFSAVAYSAETFMPYFKWVSGIVDAQWNNVAASGVFDTGSTHFSYSVT